MEFHLLARNRSDLLNNSNKNDNNDNNKTSIWRLGHKASERQIQDHDKRTRVYTTGKDNKP